MATKQPAVKTKKPSSKAVTKTKENSLSLPVFDVKGKEVETVELSKEVFDTPASTRLIAQAVYVLQTNKRQGNAHTKTRGDVSGSGKKIYRQKGTGRARHGDRYAPIFVGGGVTHGPKTKDFSIKLSAPMRKKALAGVLTAKRKENNIVIVDSLKTVEPKTKTCVEMLSKLSVAVKQSVPGEKVLVMTAGNRDNIYKGLRNAKKVLVRDTNLVNVYEILNTKKIIVEKTALEILAKRV